jgi:hypothetical protein
MAKAVKETKKGNTKVAKKTQSKNDILKKLSSQKMSDAERAKLMEKLYDGIEFKSSKKKK